MGNPSDALDVRLNVSMTNRLWGDQFLSLPNRSSLGLNKILPVGRSRVVSWYLLTAYCMIRNDHDSSEEISRKGS